MFRYVMALVAVVVLSAAVQAENIRGTVKSVDSNKSITVTVGTTERTLDLAPSVRVLGSFNQGRLGRRTVTMQMSNGLNSLQPNNQVMVTTQTINGQEVVTQIQLEGVVFNGGGRRLRR